MVFLKYRGAKQGQSLKLVPLGTPYLFPKQHPGLTVAVYRQIVNKSKIFRNPLLNRRSAIINQKSAMEYYVI
jgi:hypothetical protein